MGPNSHQDLCNLWAKVHRTFFTEGRRNRSGKIGFPILDILSRSGDIRDQSRRLYKIDRNFACFWPQIFLGEGPPNFWTCIIQSSQFPIVWQSFAAIGRGTSENAWRKEKKHHEHFIRPPVTTVHGRPNKFHNIRARIYSVFTAIVTLDILMANQRLNFRHNSNKDSGK